MNENSVDSAISELLNLKRDSGLTSPLKDQIDNLLLGLRFLELYTQCLAKWNEALQDKKNRHLKESKIRHIKASLGGATKGLYSTGINAHQKQDFQDWDSLATELLEKIQLCKENIQEDCLDFLDCSFQYKFSSFELQKFYSCLTDSLNELVRLKADMTVDLKIQIQGMKDRLQLFIQISEFNPNMDSGNKDVKDFKILIQTWLHNTACLSLLYWIVEEKQEEIECKKKIFLSTPRITRMFLAVLKSLWSSLQNRLLMHEGVSKFADFFLEILQLCPLKDDIGTLRNGLIFLTTFLVDPPLAKDTESIGKKVESIICSLSTKELKGTAKESHILLNTFLEKMNEVIAEVSKLYVRVFEDSSSFNFPSTNVLGFVDSLLENLKEISKHSTSHEVVIVQEVLLSLRPSLETILGLQKEYPEVKEHSKIKDIWTQIVNAVYRAKIGIDLLLYTNNSVWYDVKCLSDVTDEIKLLKSEMKKIQDEEISNIKVPVTETYTSPAQANLPKMDEVVVGFEDESKAIVDLLMGDSTELCIVTIVGMAGQGKTTLAKQIYNNPSVQKHFNKRAWCVVSQTFQPKRLLLEILSDIAVLDGDLSTMAEEDLAELLFKRLSGQKYLIVMDDIWDLRAWHALKLSFPHREKGSRIIFTSRIEDVASELGDHCILHHLRQLSFDESWELLKRKLFDEEDYPPNLAQVSKQIARDCNGLPLAVVVIAGILSEKVDNLDWWTHIAQSIDSRASDGCMDILELSYKHLPEFLKPCFLYFGAFQEDRVIRVRKLIQLWISEGFVRKSGLENLEDVGMEYLKDLVARSLVVVTRRSSNGGIKACRIHDLLHQFCLEKGRKENFLQVESWIDPSPISAGSVSKSYRICIQTGGDGFFASNPTGPCVHSLLFVPDYSFYMNEWEFFSIGNFKLLRVLDLEDIELDGYFPEEVVLLVLLTYLAIWCPSGTLSIPPSIASLRNLETFRVKRNSRFGNEVRLPNTIWTMKRVRHIDVGKSSVSFSDDCEPEESYQLHNLQTFSAPSLSHGEAAEKLLKRLPKVRKLRCQFDDSWDPREECNQFPVLDSLSQLESLNMVYTGKVQHPCVFGFPLTLKKLTLADFKLPWHQISTIGKLHELEVLKLLDDACDGETWDLEDGEFSKLKFLKLCNLNIEQWNTGDYPFPLLEQLIVEDCYKLEGIPSNFGESIDTLRRIEVRWCNSAVISSARQIEEEQLGRGNERFKFIDI